MKATLSILGLLEMDETILNGIILPSGLSLDTLKNNIILECAELEVIYSAPSFFRWAVDCWAIKEFPVWERMWNAIQTEYNPLENYDRTETTTETGTHSKEESITESGHTTAENTLTESGSYSKEDHDTDTTDKDSSSSGTTHSESESNTSSDHFVYGFNDSSQVKQSSDTGTDTTETDGTTSATGTENTEFEHSGTESGSNTGSHSGTESETRTGSRTGEESSDNSLTRNSRIHGNIGVTTSQQMLTAELELDKKINMYDIITKDFRNRFCILMY